MRPRQQAHVVVAASLANYDASAGTLVDTNIWVDCIDEAGPWHEWAVAQLQACSERSPLHVNLIIYTELLVPGRCRFGRAAGRLRHAAEPSAVGLRVVDRRGFRPLPA